MAFTAFIFVISLLGIIALFVLRHWEEKNQRVLAPGVRVQMDDQALRLKKMFLGWQAEADTVPPKLLQLIRWCIHELAIGFASLARLLERQAHRLADMVSHKHHFVQREQKNEFLKRVGEYRNGNGEPLDTTR